MMGEIEGKSDIRANRGEYRVELLSLLYFGYGFVEPPSSREVYSVPEVSLRIAGAQAECALEAPLGCGAIEIVDGLDQGQGGLSFRQRIVQFQRLQRGPFDLGIASVGG